MFYKRKLEFVKQSETEAMDWKPIHYKDLVRPMVFPQRRDSRFVEPYDPQEENTTLKGWVRRGWGCVINQRLGRGSHMAFTL